VIIQLMGLPRQLIRRVSRISNLLHHLLDMSDHPLLLPAHAQGTAARTDSSHVVQRGFTWAHNHQHCIRDIISTMLLLSFPLRLTGRHLSIALMLRRSSHSLNIPKDSKTAISTNLASRLQQATTSSLWKQSWRNLSTVIWQTSSWLLRNDLQILYTESSLPSSVCTPILRLHVRCVYQSSGSGRCTRRVNYISAETLRDFLKWPSFHCLISRRVGLYTPIPP
jgi:hypothetical protein